MIREYVRLSTTALDAYVGPVVSRYFTELDRSLKEARLTTGQSYVMQSNGGLMRITLAGRASERDPPLGPRLGRRVRRRVSAALLGRLDLVTLDMGGTSTDISVIRNGEIGADARGEDRRRQEIGTPMTEIHTIGAGGGTIAWIGTDGLLKVGPQSAGAEPGPACYGRGGTEPTVTDANVVLGYLDPSRFLGGRMKGDPELATEALERMGEALGLDALGTAIGVSRIVNTHMAIGLRLTLEAKGCDPGRFVLVAFGGAGPLHAWRAGRGCRDPDDRRAAAPRASPARRGCCRPTSSTSTCRASSTASTAPRPATSQRGSTMLVERALADAVGRGLQPRASFSSTARSTFATPTRGTSSRWTARSRRPDRARPRAAPAGVRRASTSRSTASRRPGEPVEIVNLRIRAVVPVESPETPARGARRRRRPTRRRSASVRVHFESLGRVHADPVYDRELSTRAPSSPARRSSSSSTRPPSSAPAGPRHATGTEPS